MDQKIENLQGTVEGLRQCVINNDLENVKKLIETYGVDINSNLNYSRLSSASGFWVNSLLPQFMTDAKDKFLELGQASYEENKDSASYRAMHWAARKGYLEMLRYLCDKGADINIPNFIGNTPLHVALYYNQKEAAKIILEYHPKLDIKNTGSLLGSINENFAPLHYAALYGDVESIHLLLKAGATADIKGLYDLTPLHFAATVGDTEKINSLLSVNQEINCQDSGGRTPLHHAVLAGVTNPAAVAATLCLLEHGASPNTIDHKNLTPLELLITTANEQMLDITPEQLKIAQHLLTWGANQERFNSCISHTQSFNFSFELNYFLIQQCAQKNTQVLLLEKKLEESQKIPLSNPISPPIIDSRTLTKKLDTIPTHAPMIKRAAPPPPPAKAFVSKKYRENIPEEKVTKKKPVASPQDDLMAALLKSLSERRLNIAPPRETHDNHSEWDDADTSEGMGYRK